MRLVNSRELLCHLVSSIVALPLAIQSKKLKDPNGFLYRMQEELIQKDGFT